MKSSSAGIQAKDVIPQFKIASESKTDPTLGTYYPILDLSGSGMFYQGMIQTNDLVTTQILTLKVTLDGVVLLTATSPDQAGGVTCYIDTISTLKTLGAGELNYTVPFKNSLLVEMKSSATLVAGKFMNGKCIHGEN